MLFRQEPFALQESGIDGWRRCGRYIKKGGHRRQMPAFEKRLGEIDLNQRPAPQFRHAVKARSREMPLCAVVKADSYGHGAVECAKVFAEEGAAWLAVSAVWRKPVSCAKPG